MKAFNPLLTYIKTYFAHAVIAVCLLAQANGAQAQSASPYSRYGLGYIRPTTFSANGAMGRLGAPYASASQINFINPASYASLLRTTIDAGFNAEGASIHSGDSVYKTVNGSINHIAIAFVPKPDKFAFTIGLLPYSNVNYAFVQSYNDTGGIGATRNLFRGAGSLYQVYGGAAYKFKSRINELDNFSIGFNAGYVFGQLAYQKVITFPDSVHALSTRNVTVLNAKSFNYSAGVQYRRRIFHDVDSLDDRKDVYITIGAYGSGGIKMGANVSNYWDRFEVSTSSGVTIPIDTIESSFNQKSKITMPFNIGAGVMFGNERFWMLGVDFKYANWSNYNSVLDNDNLGDSWQISAGFQITPKYDERAYFNRVQYRFGGYYGKSPFIYSGQQLTEAGGTVGIGLPFKMFLRTSAMFNISGDFGTRGVAGSTTAIRENYYRLTFGFVLNDQLWFIKRKFD